ncbi:hypothetical protein PNOK_0304100 [Pyrrhoderma noxium]|uniref:Uncharacterized protein n=1 Tax=Pyrrhoderma noxium TaxID=2282107 RepID=A0A286ULN8_9AGAM|nr:hypothetical protein PNOK_0304100 [Pyrrhoderma noxium]
MDRRPTSFTWLSFKIQRLSRPQCLVQLQSTLLFEMEETSRLLQAASVLSQVLTENTIPHAFHGTILIAILANSVQCGEIFCIVEGGTAIHPFGRVRQTIEGHETLTATISPWTNRLHVTYTEPIPPVSIEILPAGEEGPRRLDQTTVARIRGLPFLSVSEFLRAKLNAWSLHARDPDAQDIVWVMTHYWQSVDINRIPEQDMERFVLSQPLAAPAWAAIKDRFAA